MHYAWYPGEQEVMMWFSLGELSIPDSELALKATKLVAEISPQFLYHHRDFLICQFNRATAGNEIENCCI